MKGRYWIAVVLLLALAACSTGNQGNQGIWDNSKWEQAIWQ